MHIAVSDNALPFPECLLTLVTLREAEAQLKELARQQDELKVLHDKDRKEWEANLVKVLFQCTCVCIVHSRKMNSFTRRIKLTLSCELLD